MSRIFTAFLLAAVLTAGPTVAQTNAPNHAGFPVTIAGGGVVRFGKPLVVDLDNNGGAKEIVVGTCVNTVTSNPDCDGGRRLYVFNSNGTVRSGWPQFLAAEPASGPAAGDLDGDGVLEIVIGRGSVVAGEWNGGVLAFHANGTLMWTFNTSDQGGDGLPDPVYSSPALADLDGDGKDDVVFGSFDSKVYAVKGTTHTVLPGWPVFVRDSVFPTAAIADLNGDGKLEIVIGADSHFEGPPIDTPNGGALFVFRANGSNFPGFPKFAPTTGGIVGFQSSPAVGDIDGDGCPEIVIGTGQSGLADGKFLHAWHRDGTLVSGWPRAMGGHVATSPALGNLDADAALEVVATDDTFNVYAFNGDGSQIFKMRPKTSGGASAVGAGEPVIAQIGSDNPAILVGNVGFEIEIISKTGAQISDDGTHGGKLTYSTGHPVGAISVADLDSDGGLEVIAASGSTAVNETDLGVFAWTIAAGGSNLPWPQFHQGSQRRGTAPGAVTAACALPNPPTKFFTLTPCRVADSRQSGNLTYGGPIYAAGEKRDITFTGVCGIPATARAVAINVTVTGANLPGLLTLYPGGDGTPTATTINYKAAHTRANNAVLPLSFDGRGHLTIENVSTGVVHVILDVNGYFQ